MTGQHLRATAGTTGVQALICERFGALEDLRIREIDIPPPGPDEVSVQVHACGINFPDVLLVKGAYQERPPLPFCPGGEFSGTVLAVGARVSRFAPDDPVMGVVFRGALAEQLNVPAAKLRAVPSNMSMEAAACFQGVYATSFYALTRRAAIRHGESLLVLGAAGGVGLAAVQLGKALGARVIAAASTPAKLAAVAMHGADETLLYGEGSLRDRLRTLTAGRGVDVVLDPIGGAAFAEVTRSMAWNGRYLVVGFASGEIGHLAANLPLLKGYSLVGVYYGRFCNEEPAAACKLSEELEGLYTAGAIRPVIDRVFEFHSAVDALRCLEQRQAVGKVVVRIRDSARWASS